MDDKKKAAPTGIGGGLHNRPSSIGNSNISRLRGGQSRCPVCRQVFNSVSGFDLHRVGVHGVSRRCLSPDAMLSIGMSIGKAGLWIERPRRKATQNNRPQAQETRSPVTLTLGAAR